MNLISKIISLFDHITKIMKTSFLIILSFITNFLYSQNLSNYPEINELKIKETKCIDLKEKKKIVKKIAINYLKIIYNMDEWKEMESFRLIEAFEIYIYRNFDKSLQIRLTHEFISSYWGFV